MRRSRVLAAAWCLTGLFGTAYPTSPQAGCTGSEKVNFRAAASIAAGATPSLRRIEPHYFGFSFVWVEFQDSLWDVHAGRVNSTAAWWLRHFPGAVYRFPGGTESNYFDWKAAVGAPEVRPGRKLVKWKDQVVAKFGLDEYLAFVDEVGGQPWYVANLFGEYSKEGDARDLAASAGQLAAYLRGKGVLRWELGNELDRGWSDGKYVFVARQVAEAIRAADAQARFVAVMEDHDAHWRWRRQRAADYNQAVASGLADFTSEFAQHSYYDGRNVDVPQTVPDRIAQICQSIDAAAKVGPVAGPVGIWVTEHARQPVKASKDADWRPTWGKSADLEAALGVADFMIAATQVPEIDGLFVHALHGLGAPWPMFHRDMSGERTWPSAVFHTLYLLRQTMEADVLRTTSHSPNSSNYPGGYDIRAVVMTNPQLQRWAIWTVNRSNQDRQVALKLPALAGRALSASARVLGDAQLGANNYLDGGRLQPRVLPMNSITFDRDGNAQILIPGQSIAVFRLEIK